MSKNVAIIDSTGEVIAINVHTDDYVPQPYEVQVVDAAWVGGSYINGSFYPPQPYNSWTLNEETCLWEPPIPYPADDKEYVWNEENGAWEEIS